MLIAVVPLLLTIAAEQPSASTPAWREAKWGMTEEEVLAAFPGEARRLPKPVVFSEQATATLEIPSVDVAGKPYNVTFQFSPATRKLVHIQLKHESDTAPISVMFDELRTRLIEKYGQPADHSEGGDTRDITWFQNDTEIQLALIDLISGTKILMRAVLINYSRRPPRGTKNL
jgi:hypothetical protein